jgi:hypothetical protein
MLTSCWPTTTASTRCTTLLFAATQGRWWVLGPSSLPVLTVQSRWTRSRNVPKQRPLYIIFVAPSRRAVPCARLCPWPLSVWHTWLMVMGL